MIKNLKFLIFSLTFIFSILTLAFTVYAKEITIVYTGETHAMIYPCTCPKEPDGGIARRATLIKEIRKKDPQVLLLDAGGFFAGGLMDEYSQNTELDKQRTLVNLKAMGLMQYDAVAAGEDEFNFGKDFLEENINQLNIPVVCANLKTKRFIPYAVKEISGIKIGIIGLSNLSARQKVSGLNFVDARTATGEAIAVLQAKKTDLIILLSHLGKNEALSLINEVKGIDIIIEGHAEAKEEAVTKVDSTIVLKPSWQGRKLNKITLTLEGGKIKDYKTQDLRLSDKVSDDPQMLSILPSCFSDSHCRKENFSGTCLEAGTMNARCEFTQAAKINLTVITPKQCSSCNTENTVNYLKKQFPGLNVSYLYHPDAKANKLIENLKIKTLPVYLLEKSAEKEKGFDALKTNLENKGDFYILKPYLSGVSYFLERKREKGRIDLFISLYAKDTEKLLEAVKDFKPQIHFLALERKEGGFDAMNENIEIEEDLRAVCVQKYYPADFWSYLGCRAKNINSSWWEDCLEKQDIGKIKVCAKGEEGRGLLKENIKLTQELQILFGPTYLVDNQEIFGTQGPANKEGLKKLLKR